MNTATEPNVIVQIAKQYVETWDELDWRRLPPYCMPPGIRTEQDVSNYAFVLAQAQLEFQGAPDLGMFLDRITHFFTVASTRIAHVTHLSRVKL